MFNFNPENIRLSRLLPKHIIQILHKIDEKIIPHISGQTQITRNNLSFKVSRSIRFRKFWSNDAWEKNTFKVLKKYLDRQHSYIDVGAWVGPTVLYGSQLSRHAYAVEPDPVAISYLRKNISLNPDLVDKISVIDYCIGPENGIVRLGTKTAGDSESSLLSIEEANFFQVKSITFDTLIESFKINDCNFIKMDIEGGEFLILPALKRFIKKFYPTLYLSIHGFQSKRPLDDMKSISDVLSNYNYFENEHGQKIDVEELLVKKAWRQEPHAILATNR